MKNVYPAVALFRLNKLERKEYYHFAIVFVVILVGTISHFTPHTFLITTILFISAIIAELLLFAQEFLKLASPNEHGLKNVNVFSEQRLRIATAQLPVGYRLLSPVPDQSIIYSIDFNKRIVSGEAISLTQLKHSIEKKVLSQNAQHLHEAFAYLTTKLSHSNQPFYNEKKVSLRSELNTNTKFAVVGRTSYIMGALTNDACVHKIVRHNQDRELLYADLTSMYPMELRNGQNQVLDLDESHLSNHIGSSTIALFRQKDGTVYMLLPVQGKNAARSAGKFVPTGSGSCDWSDIKSSNANDLNSLVTYSATRELCEEHCLISGSFRSQSLAKAIAKHKIKTMAIGYYRWLNVGAKPEFCSVSILDVNAMDDIQRQASEIATDKKEICRKVISIRHLQQTCNDILNLENISIQLAMNLQFLVDALSDVEGSQNAVDFISPIFEK